MLTKLSLLICTFSTLTHASALACAGKRLNWFHVQETYEWTGFMTGVGKAIWSTADSIEERFPNSKYGAAIFQKAADGYNVLSDLTTLEGMKSTRDDLFKSDCRNAERSDAFGQIDTGLRQMTYDDPEHPATAPLIPLVWSALLATWDEDENVVKFISVNSRHVPYFQDVDYEQSKNPADWPVTPHDQIVDKSEKLPIISDSHMVKLTKETLADRGIQLIVNYANHEKASPQKAWEDLFQAIGVDRSKFLAFVPGCCDRFNYRVMASNLLVAMETAMDCTWGEAPMVKLTAETADGPCGLVYSGCHTVPVGLRFRLFQMPKEMNMRLVN